MEVFVAGVGSRLFVFGQCHVPVGGVAGDRGVDGFWKCIICFVSHFRHRADIGYLMEFGGVWRRSILKYYRCGRDKLKG